MLDDKLVSGDTLLNSEAVFEFWGVIFSFMLKEEEKISMVSPELTKIGFRVKHGMTELYSI
jgi:hypothetical protein